MNVDVSEISKKIMDHYDLYANNVSNRIEQYNSHLLIDEIENNFPVDEISLLDGTKLWNIIRIFIAYELPKLASKKNINSKKPSPSKKSFKKYISIFREGIAPLDSIKEENLFFAFSSSESRKKIDDKYIDIYFDSLYELFDDKLVVCEWPESSGFRRDYENNVFSNKFIKMHIPLISRAFFELVYDNSIRKKKVKITPINTVEDIIEFIELKSSIDKSFIKENLNSYLSTFKILKRFFLNFLIKNSPKATLFRCAYGRFPMACIQACKELNIPTIEVQHGFFSSFSSAYVKKNYSNNHDCLPDYLLTFGDIFKHIVEQGYIIENGNVYSAGFPYLQQKIKNEKKTNPREGTRTILFSSQWTLDEKIIEFIVKVGLLLDEKKLNAKILFKPHPFSQTDVSIFNNINSIEVSGKLVDFYSLLVSCDIHSTVYSTTGIEAFAFGKPTIYIDLLHLNKDNESIFFAENPSQYLDNIEYILENNDEIQKESERISGMYYKDNALDNFKTIFKELGLL